MSADGVAAIAGPRWLLAELTYACPLQCPYCSNPLDYAAHGEELGTEDWRRVLREARALGALQLGLSGGEPLVRPDLDALVHEARTLGYYSNLITSGYGLDDARVAALREAGLDHIQISFQAPGQELNDRIAGTRTWAHKVDMARAVKRHGFPMVLCFVIYRDNIAQIGEMLALAETLEADYVELATVQYYGWAARNRARLLPTLEQVREAEAAVQAWRAARAGSATKVYFVVPDYYEKRPKPCMNGWGSVFLTVTPDGLALPCHAARQLPGLAFPDLRTSSVHEAWYASDAFNRFRGRDWMREPCRSCPEQEQDFGGCRCQAYLYTGDPANTDPVCEHSPLRGRIDAAIAEAAATPREFPLLFRNPRNSRRTAAEAGVPPA